MMKTIPRLVILLLTLAAALAARAQSGVTLPATFGQFTAAADITDGGVYVIGGTDEKGDFSILGTTVYKSKLRGKTVTPADGTLTIDDEQYLWTIRSTGGGKYRITSVKEGTALCQPKSDGTDLTLTAPDKATEWSIEENGADGFVVRSPERILYASMVNIGSPVTFGCYKSTYNLAIYLYKLTGQEVTPPGTAAEPTVGKRVALYADGTARATDGTALSTDDLLLADGTLAPDDRLEAWMVSRTADGYYTFQNSRGLYLDYSLNASSEPVEWQYTNGHLATREASARHLCYDAAARRWTVSADASLTDVRFAEVADEPIRILTPEGKATLSGGWSATRLAALDWQGIRCLDLTATSLPRAARSFDAQPPSHNTPIYIKESERRYAPAGWPFLVACGTAGNKLCGSVVLADKEPLYTDRPIAVNNQSVTYTRTGCPTDRYQTACLPFNATVEKGKALILTGIDGQTLTFESSNLQMSTGEGCLILPDGTGTFSAKAQQAGVIESNIDITKGRFLGMTDTVTVGATENVYFLHPTQNVFKRAAEGSTLAPFRAYIQADSAVAAPVRRIRVAR